MYVLKEDLRELWRQRTRAAARRAWQHWYQRACESGIAALVRFANRLALSAEYIINHARHPLHTSLLEGINNKIKVMKRMAYGYRDDAYFFLKIRAAFPGIPGRTQYCPAVSAVLHWSRGRPRARRVCAPARKTSGSAARERRVVLGGMGEAPQAESVTRTHPLRC